MSEPIQTIELSDKFESAVINGHKTQTTRKGLCAYRLGPALLHCGNTYIPITIMSLRLKHFDELTKTEAQRDGFATLAEFKDSLRQFYPTIDDSSLVTVVTFYVEEAD